ncbi:MAG: SAM-dependent DNA methyltransferase [Armatimonadetes bacterium]|nr:SAM-dependent DNA methyltransferase [Armatimonadota bacterium]
MAKKKAPHKGDSDTDLGFEAKLWQAADKLRNNMDAAEYKHVVLGLIFLKYISDAFNERHLALLAEKTAGADPEDPDEYRSENVFWVPKEARWAHLQAGAKQPHIGRLVDDAMVVIEHDNPSLKGVLPKDYARSALDKQRLGELIDLVGTIGLGDKENRSKDILGRVYEYFLSRFASAEGKKGGQFYTPRCVVQVLVEMLRPYKGRIFDPCCGSGGMFVQSEKFVEAHGGRVGNISIYGQESNPTTWRLARMNLAIRGIDGNLGAENADSFHRELHPDLKADFILANPPFNSDDWGGERIRDDKRWKFGIPPNGNANYAWVQLFIHHMSPTGTAGFVLANGALAAAGEQAKIRKAIVDADLVDCIVVLPPKLFYTVQAPASLWLLTRSKGGKGSTPSRNGKVLFIDARKCFSKLGPKQNVLTDEHIRLISETYLAWKTPEQDKYKDVVGFCKSVSLGDIADCDYSLVPARHVGINVERPDPSMTQKELDDTVTEIRNTLGRLEALSKEVHDALELANKR